MRVFLRITVVLQLFFNGFVFAQDSLKSWSFMPDGPGLYSFTEGALCNYHHLLRYPRDYQFYAGIGLWGDFYRSSEDFSLGISADLKVGGSVRIEDFWIIELPLLLCAKYGYGNQPMNNQKLGVGFGIGPSYYYNLKANTERFIRPLWMIELSARLFQKCFFIRYSSLFSTPLFVRKSIALGGYIPIVWN